MTYAQLLLPEFILCVAACALMLLGCSMKVASRRAAPVIALLALLAVFIIEIARQRGGAAGGEHPYADPAGALRVFHFGEFIRLLAAGVGAMLLLLFWPTNAEGTGNSALNVGQETGEFLGLALLSLCGILLVASANDIILLFLGIELASIPTYIMVSISRPLAVAQEAGVKYFFLGAMAAAVMLFGFSYLYGVTGSIKLDQIAASLHPTGAANGVALDAQAFDPAQVAMRPWAMLAVVVLIAGIAFKILAVPAHVYAGDVYQGAATPVTAFLSFVPKTSGFVALIKVLAAAGGPAWALPPQIGKLLWVLAALTMTIGNVLALCQIQNIKRLLAYSSVAHSGYMLVGLSALTGAYGTFAAAKDAVAARMDVQTASLQGVLFYLTAYGVMNAAAFGVLMLLPSRDGRSSGTSSAETFDDLAGQGRKHVGLGLCMAVACFSLIGLPLTVGFLGKVLLIKPALAAHQYWLVVITVVNAAISAGYYLRIVGTMFLRDAPAGTLATPEPTPVTSGKLSLPIALGVGLSVAATLLLGTVLPLTEALTNRAAIAAQIDEPHVATPTPTPTQGSLRAEAR
jgi:NADH-quinone oxidoreductase subunit N